MKGENVVLIIFAVVFLFSIIMIMNQGIRTTGYATSAITTSNVTITTYFAIAMSTNLSEAIYFGSVASLPATDQNATHNYDGGNASGDGLLGTSMWMNVSSDSNTGVQFCINASGDLTSAGADTIGLANETYANYSSATNVTWPDLSDAIALTTAYNEAGTNISAGSDNYYRFWLDLPAATPAGTYNNTVGFAGVAAGSGC